MTNEQKIEAAAREISVAQGDGRDGVYLLDKSFIGDIIRKHFAPPAETGEVRVNGRVAELLLCDTSVHITSADSPRSYLNDKCEWESYQWPQRTWPTREAAEAFLRKHADKPERKRDRIQGRYFMIATAAPCPIDTEIDVCDELESSTSSAASSSSMAADNPAKRRKLVVKVSVPFGDSKTSRADLSEEYRIDDFLETTYLLVGRGHTRKAIDWVFQCMNAWLTDSHFRFCDKVLGKVDVSRLNSTLMVGFLSITLPAKEFLCVRPGLYGEILGALKRQKGHDAAVRLLSKYK